MSSGTNGEPTDEIPLKAVKLFEDAFAVHAGRAQDKIGEVGWWKVGHRFAWRGSVAWKDKHMHVEGKTVADVLGQIRAFVNFWSKHSKRVG